MFDLTTFEPFLKNTFKKMEEKQAKVISLQITSNFLAGYNAAEKHKSTTSNQDEQLTDSQKEEIAVLVATYLGYLQKFNSEAKNQLIAKIRDIFTENTGDKKSITQQVKQYINDIFEGKEHVIIDNRGKVKKEIYVDKNLILSEVEKVIEKTDSTSIKNYSGLLSESISHSAYDTGRRNYFIENEYLEWVFVGPADETTRPWHLAIIGSVFIYNTDQSEYAQHCLEENRCRHWAERYYGDSRDKSPEYWQKIKDDVGLYWNQSASKWMIKKD